MTDAWSGFRPQECFIHPGTGDLVLVLTQEQSKRLRDTLTDEQWEQVKQNGR
jgi:hypothetical protein